MMNFFWVMLNLEWPTKPGDEAPPPMTPARVVNFMPQGVSPAYSRLTVMTPLQEGSMAAMASQQPQVVMGSLTME